MWRKMELGSPFQMVTCLKQFSRPIDFLKWDQTTIWRKDKIAFENVVKKIQNQKNVNIFANRLKHLYWMFHGIKITEQILLYENKQEKFPLFLWQIISMYPPTLPAFSWLIVLIAVVNCWAREIMVKYIALWWREFQSALGSQYGYFTNKDLAFHKLNERCIWPAMKERCSWWQ